MKKVITSAFVFALVCASMASHADESAKGPVSFQVQTAGGVTQGPNGDVSPAVSASGMVQYNFYKAKIIHDQPYVLDLAPKVEGSITIDPSKPKVDNFSVNVDLFRVYAISHRDPASPVYGWQQGLTPHLGVSRDNQLKLTMGPALEIERSGVIYSKRYDDGSIDKYCSVLAPMYYVAPDQVGFAWTGPNATKGMKIQWDLDARCRINLGHKVGQLDLQAGASAGLILTENPNAHDGSLYFTTYARADLKKIGGSGFYVGTEAADTGVFSRADGFSTVKTLTGHVGIVY